MSDYIRREDVAVYRPKPKSERDYQTYNIDDAYEIGYDDKIKEILTLPAADVRKNVRGEWVCKRLDTFRKYQCECPFCHAVYVDNYDAYIDVESFNYCPNCGAEMRGEKDE